MYIYIYLVSQSTMKAATRTQQHSSSQWLGFWRGRAHWLWHRRQTGPNPLSQACPSNMNLPNMAWAHCIAFASHASWNLFVLRDSALLQMYKSPQGNEASAQASLGANFHHLQSWSALLQNVHGQVGQKVSSSQVGSVETTVDAAKRSRVVSGTANPPTQRPQPPAQESQSFQSIGKANCQR